MKKIFVIFLLCLPFVAKADNDLEMRNQILDSEILRLTNERDTKYEKLQKCEKSTKGFKIAGISTLVATGVGVYGNVKLSQKLKNKNGGSGGKSVAVIDNRPQEVKNDESCQLLCDLGGAPSECGC